MSRQQENEILNNKVEQKKNVTETSQSMSQTQKTDIPFRAGLGEKKDSSKQQPVIVCKSNNKLKQQIVKKKRKVNI